MKPYFIFVEGCNTPRQALFTESQAEQEGKRLAKLAEGKKVYVLQIVKRLMCVDGEVVSLGSHVHPESHVTIDDLVTHDRIPKKPNPNRPILKLAKPIPKQQ